jgi:lipid A 4'-phosphatase
VKGIAVYLGLVAAATALFLLLPQADLATSALFYDPQSGFALAGWGPVQAISAAVPWLVRAVLVLAAGAALWLAAVGRPLWRLDRKAIVFIVAALALGPGLLTNTVLKDHWGRARPSQIAAFGGTAQFTAAPLPAAQCNRNCAFVSGHAALGFSFVGFALMLPRGRRRAGAQAATLGFGALVGLGRIAAGAHFLSDVVFAGLLVYGTSWLLHRWIVERNLLASSAARRLYEVGRRKVADAWRRAGPLYLTPIGRLALWAAGVAALEALLIGVFDEKLALFLHAGDAAIRPLFDAVGRLGLAFPYLALLALAYAALRWGGALPRLRRIAGPMRRAAAVPAFIFASLVASGLIVDLLKVVCGRARPKLLFAAGTYDFGWLGLQADRWSFPSGHAATVAALMTALWCLWPRHLLFYVLFGTIVAASRIVTGAHYPSDVVMGAFIAIVTTRALAVPFGAGRFDVAALRLGRRGGGLPEPSPKP